MGLNAWGRMFNLYHSIFAPYPRGTMSLDVTVKVRVRCYESDAAKWAAFEAAYPGQSANDFYAYCVAEDLEADPPEFTLWMDARHYGDKILITPNTLGHEFLHAIDYARAVQNEEAFPASDMVDADQLTGLEPPTVSDSDVTDYKLSGAPETVTGGTDMLDKSKRILGVASDWYSVTVLGATNGPFTIPIGDETYTISADTVVSGVTDLDTGSISNGKDYYVYACLSGGIIVYKTSLSASYPSGFSASTSYLLGGFHTLAHTVNLPPAWSASKGVIHGQWCIPVGADGYDLYKYRAQYQGVTGAAEPTWPTTPGNFVSDNTTVWQCALMGLSGRYQSNVVPNSIWDLVHRARCLDNRGMTYDPKTGIWVDNYLPSGSSGGSTLSAYGGTVTRGLRWTTAVAYGHAVGKRLMTDHEFQSAADGVWEEAAKYGSAPTATGNNESLFALRVTFTMNKPYVAPITGLSFVGQSSGAIVSPIYLLSSMFNETSETVTATLVYACKNHNGTAFTLGEIISDGTTSYDCNASTPTIESMYTYNSDVIKHPIISNIGCHDMAGVFDQWLLDSSFMIVGADYNAAKTFAWDDLDDGRGSRYLQSEVKMVAGGSYADGNAPGSQCRKLMHDRDTQVATVSARYCCERL